MSTFNPYEAPLSAVDGRSAGAQAPAQGMHTPTMVEALRGTRPWVLFLAILGFIGCGFMVLGGLMMAVAGAVAGQSAGWGVAQGILLGLVYVFLGAFYAFFSWLLVRYATAIGRLLATNETQHVEGALEAQRVFWKVMGITTIVMMVLSVVGMVAAMAIGVMAAASGFSP
jgi:hypothetical protein